MEIPERLQVVLARTGLKKKGLAELAGVTARTVSRWFKGQSIPEPENLRRISVGTGISLLWISEGTGPLKSSALWSYYAKERLTPILEGQIYSRIDEIIVATGTNKAKLAADAGLQDVLHLEREQWIGDCGSLSPWAVRKIAEWSGYSFEWLWYGQGLRLENSQKPGQDRSGNNSNPREQYSGKIAATIEPGDKRRGSRDHATPHRPSETQACLKEIVEWMDDYFGADPAQGPVFNRDLYDRYPSFRAWCEKKRSGGDTLDTSPGIKSAG